MIDQRKIGIIGCGFVGAASAFSLMQSGLFSEMVLLDADHDRAEGEAMDISHGLPYASPMEIYAGTYADLADCAIVIITAGAAQKPGESRLNLVQRNAAIYRTILPELMKYGFDGILLIVSNPVDILTTLAVKETGLPESRVFGSGTVLDTARLKYHIGRHLNVDSRDVQAYIIGEHGDSELAAWSCVRVGGMTLPDFCELRGHHRDHEAAAEKLYEEVKNSAYEIISKKRATYFGVAMAVRRICACIARDEHSVLSVSRMLHGEYGVSGLALSLPTVVNANGVETLVPIRLNEQEAEKLHQSAQALEKILREI